MPDRQPVVEPRSTVDGEDALHVEAARVAADKTQFRVDGGDAAATDRVRERVCLPYVHQDTLMPDSYREVR